MKDIFDKDKLQEGGKTDGAIPSVFQRKGGRVKMGSGIAVGSWASDEEVRQTINIGKITYMTDT